MSSPVDNDYRTTTNNSAPPFRSTQPMEDSRLLGSPLSPTTPGGVFDAPSPSSPRMTRRSPLNPSSPPVSGTFGRNPNPHSSSTASMSSRPGSRSSSTQAFINPRRNDEDPFSPSTLSVLGLGAGAGVGGLPPPSLNGQRGSMILYRLADEHREPPLLAPPTMRGARDSVASSSASSFVDDTKYPSSMHTPRGLVPYEYDPEVDELDPPDAEDLLHDPESKEAFPGEKREFPWRGVLNVTVLLLLIGGLLTLFVGYPVITAFRDRARNLAAVGNLRINGTGQSPVLFQMPELIDADTPMEARTRTGFDGLEYDLVFSDEFNVPGRTFYPGDDPYWEAVDLWYGATQDLEWYDPQQVTTRDGALVITMDSTSQWQAGVTSGSTAPFTAAQNHNLDYRSGMIQTWNKFCFTSGYIEVSVTFPGPDDTTAGYWPGAWTMGNLARPGYPATTDGLWPYTYDSCDVGTFPNQTERDGVTPAAAVYTPYGQTRFNNELSWLSGQRLSACSCPGSDHPGPVHTKGRGSPEIDIFEASRDKARPPMGGTVSQSAQFAPFNADWIYDNSTVDAWTKFNDLTRANTYRGSGVQQSVSGVTLVPSDMFQGNPNKRFVTFGFEYWGNQDDRENGYIHWQVDDQPTHRAGAKAVGADPRAMIGPRIIPEEPMAIILNLGMSASWQTIDLSTMMFPGEMLVDYVRVYQRKDAINIGCDPKEYPTKKYIEDHLEAYQDVNMTEWRWEKPRNRLWEGSC